jgi:hypothetical protein
LTESKLARIVTGGQAALAKHSTVMAAPERLQARGGW